MSNKQKTHTPGPWGIDNEQRDLRIVARGRITPVAFVSRLYREDATSAALDAKLIAAAPALLDACIAALSFIESLPYEPSNAPSTRLQDQLHDLIDAVR